MSIRRATPMMGTSDPQPSMFYHINLEQFVSANTGVGSLFGDRSA
jgi:hypothetical protein